MAKQKKNMFDDLDQELSSMAVAPAKVVKNDVTPVETNEPIIQKTELKTVEPRKQEDTKREEIENETVEKELENLAAQGHLNQNLKDYILEVIRKEQGNINFSTYLCEKAVQAVEKTTHILKVSKKDLTNFVFVDFWERNKAEVYNIEKLNKKKSLL